MVPCLELETKQALRLRHIRSEAENKATSADETSATFADDIRRKPEDGQKDMHRGNLRRARLYRGQFQVTLRQ